MKACFRAMMMCFGMFCAIPCPYRGWDEDARPLMTLFLPLVGAFIGALWTLAAFLLRFLGAPALIAGAVLCALPFLLTGGIHADGFMDVVDAVRSCREPDERRRILKDPHVGSFAVLFTVLLITAQFALFAAAKQNASVFGLLLIAVVSRSTAALSVTILRPLSESEYAGVYRRGVKKSHVFILLLPIAASVACGFLLFGNTGLIPLAVIAGSAAATLRGRRSLGGMSGDIAGYALTVGELCGAAAYALI